MTHSSAPSAIVLKSSRERCGQVLGPPLFSAPFPSSYLAAPPRKNNRENYENYESTYIYIYCAYVLQFLLFALLAEIASNVDISFLETRSKRFRIERVFLFLFLRMDRERKRSRVLIRHLSIPVSFLRAIRATIVKLSSTTFIVAT